MKRAACGTDEGAVLWMNMDPCGIICAMVTWGLILFAQFVTNACILRPWLAGSAFGAANAVLFNGLAILCYIAHLRAMTTDPGAVHRRAQAPVAELEAGTSRGDAENRNMRRWCRKCDAYKPVRAHHCSICRRCIVKMDHHCPWVNNCVGISNHKFFILFVTYVFALSLYALALVAARFLACMSEAGALVSANAAGGAAGAAAAGSDAAAGAAAAAAAERTAVAGGRGEGDGCYGPANALVVLLVLESLLFGLFTMCMMLDQWSVVTTGQTQVDRLKGETHAGNAEVNEVFGGSAKRFRADWLLPTRVAFPADIWEDVMGYRLKPETELEMGKYYVPAVDMPQAQQTSQRSGRGGDEAGRDDAAASMAVGLVGDAIVSGQIRARKGAAAGAAGVGGASSTGSTGGGSDEAGETQRLLASLPEEAETPVAAGSAARKAELFESEREEVETQP